MPAIRRILHATDFSTASAAAFTKAVEMAKANRAELSLVHVLNPVLAMAGDGYVDAAVYADIQAGANAGAEKQLARLAARARKAGVARVRATVLEGVAHERIVRAAKSQRADLIVIGTHGRTGLAKLFLGSVAGRVVAAATCPVLTVRGR